MERKIGEIFTYEGKTYQVVKGNTCKDCAFSNILCYSLRILVAGCCTRGSRKDNLNVIFKEIKGMEIKDNQLIINIPEGMEIDLENSNFNTGVICFKKKQPEFKDGDIIKMTWNKYSAIAIFWEYINFGKGFDSHVFFNIKTKIIEYNIHGHTLQDMILRLATEEEKQQLFSALAKKGKAWDSEKKQIVDLNPKWITPKPFDRVITRNAYDDIWTANIFSHINQYGEYVAIGCIGGYHYCIPYNEETAKLIGTTNNLEG